MCLWPPGGLGGRGRAGRSAAALVRALIRSAQVRCGPGDRAPRRVPAQTPGAWASGAGSHESPTAARPVTWVGGGQAPLPCRETRAQSPSRGAAVAAPRDESARGTRQAAVSFPPRSATLGRWDQAPERRLWGQGTVLTCRSLSGQILAQPANPPGPRVCLCWDSNGHSPTVVTVDLFLLISRESSLKKKKCLGKLQISQTKVICYFQICYL